jgi:site-specific DNA recombinase
MMRVALYARVSSKSPDREESIDSQVAALDEFAQQKGYAYKSSDVYLDPGYSGQTFARPGLDALRDAVWEGRYDCILIYVRA